MLVMIPEYNDGNTSPVSKDSDEISFTRTRLYTPTSSAYSTDSECEFETLSEGPPEPEYTNASSSTEAEDAIENPYRQVTVNNTTDPIHGTYPLLDALSLSTTTGSIDVTLDINQDPSLLVHDNKPARVSILSDTGNIRISFQGHSQQKYRNELDDMAIVPREIAVDIRTGTGNIEGTVPFTTSLSLQTMSGCIQTVLMPIITDVGAGGFPSVPRPVPSILTTSRTGSQSVCVAEPVQVPGHGHELGQGQASHVSSEGSLNIRYPPAWTGWVELRGGSNFMAGEGIDRVHSGDGCVRGVKRKGSNDMGISLQTRGSAMFTVG